MASLYNSTIWIKIGLVTLVVALTLHGVGFSTAFWLIGEGTNLGLWQSCEISLDGYVCHNNTLQLDWFNATRAFTTMGLLIMVLAVIFLFMYAFMTEFERTTMALTTSVILSFVAGLLTLIAITVYGAKFDKTGVFTFRPEVVTVGYSFFFVLAAALLSLTAGVLNYVEYRKLIDY